MAKKKDELDVSTTVDAVVAFSGGLQFKKAMVNGVKLAFSDGQARFSIKPEIDHELEWEVVGFVGTKWSFKLISDTEGFGVTPKKLTDPGKSFTLKATTEKQAFTFSIAKSEEKAA